jgi:hypothetical protein
MKKSLLVVSLFIGATLLVWGCMGKNSPPISPTRIISLSVTVSNLNSVRAKLLGAAQNVILYRIDGTSGAPVTGSVGPFSTSGNSGSYTFAVPNFVSSGNSLLSLQLIDASTGQALAIGAAPVVSTSGVPIVTVELGSLVRPCYDISGASVTLNFGYAFGFSSDNIVGSNSATGAGLDIAFDSTVISDSNVFRVKDASTGTNDDIAFLGNGNLVDFDVVPADSAFQSIGSVLHTGDVFCVKLSTIPNAHAWIQITDPGSWTTRGPSFVYRVSTTKSYYAYETTAFDQLGGCSGAAPTNTFLDFTLDYAGNTVDATHELVGILNTGFGNNNESGFQIFNSNNAYVSFGGIPPGEYAAGFVYGAQGVTYATTGGGFQPHVGDIYQFYNPAGSPLCFSAALETGNLPVSVGANHLGTINISGACTFTGLTGSVTYTLGSLNVSANNQIYVACYPNANYLTPLSINSYAADGRYDLPDVERPLNTTSYYVRAWFDETGNSQSGPDNGDPVTQFGPITAGTVQSQGITLSDTNVFLFTPTFTPTVTVTPTVSPTPVLPLGSFAVSDTSGLTEGPGGIAVNSAGTRVYLSFNYEATANFDSNMQIWTSTDGINYSSSGTTVVLSGGCPHGLAIDASGDFYVADGCQGPVDKYSSTGSPLSPTFTGVSATSGVAVDSNGHVYAAGNSSPIFAFNSSGTTVGGWPITGGYGDPSLACNSAGTTIFVAPFEGGSQIFLYSAAGASLGTWGSGAGSFSPGGLAVAPAGSPDAGNLYVVDDENEQILEFGPTGTFLGSWGSSGTALGQFAFPSGIAVDGAGHIYVADFSGQRVQIFAAR